MAPLNTAQLAGAPYQIPPEPSRLPSALMALLVHGVLLGFLWFGINWQNTEPTAVEAEVWDMETKQAAAPLLPQLEPEPEPEPLPRPEPTPPPPTPAPKVIEPPARPKMVEPPPVQKTPDIALERQKEQKKKLLEKRLADEKLLSEKKKELAELKQKQLAEVKQKELAVLKEKQREDKKASDLAAKKDKEKADKLAKAKAAQELADTKRLDKLRDAEMARIANAAGSGGGSAAKSTSPNLDNSYKAAINAKIKGNTSFASSGAITGNPYVSFEIQQLPTGEIISVRKVKSSGVDAFDNAVERGINNSSPLPKRKDGTVERTLTVGYRLNDID